VTELVILVGVPASGKSSFVRARLAATHRHVSQDLLGPGRSREARQRRLIEDALRAGQSVVVDNTNATAAGRAVLVALGRAHGARVVGYYFESRSRDAVERNRRRQGTGRVPDVAIYVAARRMEPPSLTEGFDALYRVALEQEGGFEVTPWPPATPS
jgi:predicted kinase